MPSFGIKTQVTILSMGLLSLPVIGLSYWQQVKESTLATQTHIQEIEAKAIATSLLATQENIPALLAANNDSELYKHSLSAPPLNIRLKLDGDLDDWPEDVVDKSRIKLKSTENEAKAKLESEFSLQLSQTKQHLYVGIEVIDSMISYRRNHLRLDYGDHIRLSFKSPINEIQRIIIPAEREGALASYYSNQAWEYGIDPSVDIASHETGLQGFWRRTEYGYNLEFRIPLELMGTENAQLHIAVVDVDENPSLGPSAVITSLPSSLDKQFNPLELHARNLQRTIDHLKSSYAYLGIYDRRGREWALSGRESYQSTFDLEHSCLENALLGQVQQYQRNRTEGIENSRITTCYPITKNEETIGLVVIDEKASHVLEQQKERLQSTALKTGIAIGSIIFLMFVYALFLARRITRLSQATQNALDSHGRIIHTTINNSQNAPDEVGELSRSISSLLEQQKSYTEFLERMPQTLRHEISNPLNKLRTSLENLLDEQPTLESNRYIKKLHTGIDQIFNLTEQLTEAANLESALQNEPLSRLDLSSFLQDYCSVWEGLTISLEQTDIFIMAESSRLEQMLDKLLDNAFSFCPENGKVSLSLHQENYEVRLDIENDGPLISETNINEIFAPMTSTRSEGSEIHLGLGLHVVKIIADYHYAQLSCHNREDGSGVCFSLTFRVA